MAGLAEWAGLAGSVWLAVFQVALAAGAPLGHLAWGGAEAGTLSRGRRVASLCSAVLGAAMVLAFGQVLGFWSILPVTWLSPFFFGVAGLFALSTLGNLASKSTAERLHGAPLAAILTLSALGAALG